MLIEEFRIRRRNMAVRQMASESKEKEYKCSKDLYAIKICTLKCFFFFPVYNGNKGSAKIKQVRGKKEREKILGNYYTS